jgi:uncharacterized protein (DUF433 family)
MSKLEQIKQLLDGMDARECAVVLDRVARHLGREFPGIERTPGVCGGEPRIVRTRIPVWMLVQARRQGLSDVDLLADYPTLREDDLVLAWAYGETHAEEIDRQITENESA